MSRNINSAGTEQHQPNELMITCKTAGSNAPSLCNSPLCKIKQTRECGFLGSISPLRKLSFCKRKKKHILSFLALTFFFFLFKSKCISHLCFLSFSLTPGSLAIGRMVPLDFMKEVLTLINNYYAFQVFCVKHFFSY